LQRVEEAFRKAGFKALPADHPVYQDSAYNIRPVNIQPDYRRSAEKEMSDN